jgi:bifunctional non-homologous end joining protein LigD
MRTTFPRIQPIAPILRKEPFDGSDWLFEVKFDGYRAVAYIENRQCRLLSKKGNVMTRFSDLAAEIARSLKVKDAILDGEIVCLSEKDGRPLFMHLVRGLSLTYYAAFDLLWLNGKDLRLEPLEKRKQRLFKLIPPEKRILSIPHFESTGKKLYQVVQKHDLEGIVAKKKTDPYNSLAKWYKIKSPTYSQAEGRGELFNS